MTQLRKAQKPQNETAYHHGDLKPALLNAAVETISEIGPKGLTMREVARRTGVSHNAPYRHFADRDDLIVQVVEHGFEVLDAGIAAHREAAPDEPLAQLAAAGRGYIEFALEFPGYYRVMFSGDLLSEHGNEQLRHTGMGSVREMAKDLERCQALGLMDPGDPMLQALALTSMVHGFVMLWNDNRVNHMMGDAYSVEQMIEFVMAAVMTGLTGGKGLSISP